MSKDATIPEMIKELNIERRQAVAIKALMNNWHSLDEIFNCYGWLMERWAVGTKLHNKLVPFEDVLHDAYDGPTNIPRGTREEALRLIDKILETHGVEHIGFTHDGDEWADDVEISYCNAGDTYAATICLDGNDNFVLCCWGALVEEFEAKGYRTKESWEY